MITVFDAAGEGSAKACWALMRRASAHRPESDKFESASSPRKTSLLQAIMSCRPEKPDMYWSAPRAAEKPVISVAEIGYVRRSEVRFGRRPARERAGGHRSRSAGEPRQR